MLDVIMVGLGAFLAGWFLSKLLEKKFTHDVGYKMGFDHGYARRRSDEENERTQAYVDARVAGRPKLQLVIDNRVCICGCHSQHYACSECCHAPGTTCADCRQQRKG